MALVRDKKPLDQYTDIDQETLDVAEAIGLLGNNEDGISAMWDDYLNLLEDDPPEVAKRLRLLLPAGEGVSDG